MSLRRLWIWFSTRDWPSKKLQTRQSKNLKQKLRIWPKSSSTKINLSRLNIKIRLTIRNKSTIGRSRFSRMSSTNKNWIFRNSSKLLWIEMKNWRKTWWSSKKTSRRSPVTIRESLKGFIRWTSLCTHMKQPIKAHKPMQRIKWISKKNLCCKPWICRSRDKSTLKKTCKTWLKIRLRRKWTWLNRKRQ